MVGPEQIRTALACRDLTCRCHNRRDTHCPAHDDRSPSLGVVEFGGRLLVYCRAGCRQEEVITALRARSLWGDDEDRRRALHDIERRARREPWARPGVLEMYHAADLLRWRDQRDLQAIAEVRRYATSLGDTDEAWELLALAADAERAFHEREADEA